MHKLFPGLLLFVTGCGRALDVVELPLRDLPRSALTVPNAEFDNSSDTERVTVQLGREHASRECALLPPQTRLTANGRVLKVESLGGFNLDLPWSPSTSCANAVFTADRFPDEPRTEFILSDGETQWRAVFQNLRAVRRFRVNGQEQGQVTARSGEPLDLEWFPETDQIRSVSLVLQQERSTERIQPESSYELQGHHIHTRFQPPKPGPYNLSGWGEVTAGVEACEGFFLCEAPFFVPGISVPMAFEE